MKQTALKTWITLGVIVAVSELAKVIHFLATHYGYGENGVNPILVEFVYELQYKHIWDTWVYELLIASGVAIIFITWGQAQKHIYVPTHNLQQR